MRVQRARERLSQIRVSMQQCTNYQIAVRLQVELYSPCQADKLTRIGKTQRILDDSKKISHMDGGAYTNFSLNKLMYTTEEDEVYCSLCAGVSNLRNATEEDKVSEFPRKETLDATPAMGRVGPHSI